MQQPTTKRPATYFAVPTAQFNAVVNKLSQMPYNQVANLLSELVASSRAMYDNLPPAPKLKGPGGQVVPNVPEPPPPVMDLAPADPPANVKENGGEQPGEEIEPTENKRPGFTRHTRMDQRPDTVQEYDEKEDCWWVKDTDDIDKPKAGGAE